MARNFSSDDEDRIFFRNAMKDVRRTKQSPTLKKTSAQKKASANSVHKSISKSKQVFEIDESLLETLADPVEQPITGEEKLFFKRSGPQNKVIKQLIRGEIRRSACLDLHGMTIEQARSATINFLTKCFKANFRCVQIIHGKGQLSQSGPKLKNYINYWLPQIPWVLAFSSAQSKDGGSGAIYILLAKPGVFV